MSVIDFRVSGSRHDIIYGVRLVWEWTANRNEVVVISLLFITINDVFFFFYAPDKIAARSWPRMLLFPRSGRRQCGSFHWRSRYTHCDLTSSVIM